MEDRLLTANQFERVVQAITGLADAISKQITEVPIERAFKSQMRKT